MPRPPRWTDDDVELLRQFYADWPTAWLAPHFRRSRQAIDTKASLLGLKKAEKIINTADNDGCFRKGMVPANKGLRRPGWAPGRMRETQFKRGERTGQARRNYRPIGAEMLDKSGNLLRKVSETGDRRKDWRPVHVLVWEAAHGPVPTGHIVIFRPGKRTAVADDITADHLELVSRAENMRRNSYHNNYPKEVARLIQLKGVLNRKINSRTKIL